MNLRKFLKSFDTLVGLKNDLWKLQCALRGLLSTGALKRYLEANQIRKLQIGAGSIAIPGWLGTDLRPSDNVAFLDATKRFPMEDQIIDYVHSEHMIEHLTWQEGQFFLRECLRVLKPGGKARIATPDLRVFADLYDCREDSIGSKYIQWITDHYLQGTPEYKPGFILNSIFYRWGHKFVYDGELLEIAMRQAGFTDIKRFPAGQSDDENLRGIEMHGQISRYEEEMNTFETMVLEGIKPG